MAVEYNIIKAVRLLTALLYYVGGFTTHELESGVFHIQSTLSYFYTILKVKISNCSKEQLYNFILDYTIFFRNKLFSMIIKSKN